MNKKKEDQFPPSPFAKYQGELRLGDKVIDCYVLDTKERVISLGTTVKALTEINAGNLGDYIGTQALKPFIDKDLVLGETIAFHIPNSNWKGKGITAERFLDICNAYDAQEISHSLYWNICQRVGKISSRGECGRKECEYDDFMIQMGMVAHDCTICPQPSSSEFVCLWQRLGESLASGISVAN